MPEYSEFLIKSQDNLSIPTTSGSMHWCKGDIVSIRPSGFHWGSKEGPPIFDLIGVPAPVTGMMQYCGPWGDFCFPSGDDGCVFEYKVRSKWCYVYASGVFYNKHTGEVRELGEM